MQGQQNNARYIFDEAAVARDSNDRAWCTLTIRTAETSFLLRVLDVKLARQLSASRGSAEMTRRYQRRVDRLRINLL